MERPSNATPPFEIERNHRRLRTRFEQSLHNAMVRPAGWTDLLRKFDQILEQLYEYKTQYTKEDLQATQEALEMSQDALSTTQEALQNVQLELESTKAQLKSLQNMLGKKAFKADGGNVMFKKTPIRAVPVNEPNTNSVSQHPFQKFVFSLTVGKDNKDTEHSVQLRKSTSGVSDDNGNNV